ncbi:hypothetical protein Q1695_005092 [Nippostrongylus brasiliensis]|nr:hypothetical protein Q1695_005092 [Nippostrongylus brasiliensis]
MERRPTLFGTEFYRQIDRFDKLCVPLSLLDEAGTIDTTALLGSAMAEAAAAVQHQAKPFRWFGSRFVRAARRPYQDFF